MRRSEVGSVLALAAVLAVSFLRGADAQVGSCAPPPPLPSAAPGCTTEQQLLDLLGSVRAVCQAGRSASHSAATIAHTANAATTNVGLSVANARRGVISVAPTTSRTHAVSVRRRAALPAAWRPNFAVYACEIGCVKPHVVLAP